MPNWKPVLGATVVHNDQVVFRVWAPEAKRLTVTVGVEARTERRHELARQCDGYFVSDLTDCSAGELYHFYIDGAGPFPDPASRYQPQGVHGPSMIVNPARFQWNDGDWEGLALEKAVFYELHVGAFTDEGTFLSAAKKLTYLSDLGVNAIELMPVADFPGDRNWGYDGVSLFAPARCYGSPDDLRAFVDQAHQLGLAVFLDVVYNHFGPDGALQCLFSKYYFTSRHQTPWGDAINFDGCESAPVREFVIENALRWISEYHLDGIRLDATHAIIDDSPRHILADIVATVSELASGLGRKIHVIAEDGRNLTRLLEPQSRGGIGLDAVWADDFHHQVRRGLAGDNEGYFESFDGSVNGIAAIARQGWIRGETPIGPDYRKFVYFIQNHDQIGNRAHGDRLHHRIDEASFRAASALFLLLPQTPLLFMGQEWAASTPFCYFTDHNAELGGQITEGRRREFACFSTFSSETIPDPQKPQTFLASRLRWNELNEPGHAAMLRFHQSLLTLRRASIQPEAPCPGFCIKATDSATIQFQRGPLVVLVRLHGEGISILEGFKTPPRAVWTTEDISFTNNSMPIQTLSEREIRFKRPGAIVVSEAI